MKGGRGLGRALRVIAVAVALGSVLGGCTQEPQPTPTPAPTGSGYVSDYQAPEPVEIAPLTGRTVPAGSLTSPSIAAKIDNHPQARPQIGLDTADIVFEELVEGGMTRYLAVWHSTVPEILGPVRSIRPMDPDIASPLGGIIAYSGGQARFVSMMRATPLYNAIHGQPDTAATFYRGDAKPAPHNVLVRAREVIAQHADLAAPRQQFSFTEDPATSTAAVDGSAVATVSLRFGALSSPSWTWDAGAGKYLRSQSGVADLDAEGERIATTNLVVLRVPVSDDGGVPKTELIGSSEAYVCTGGATVRATWSKASATEPIRLVDEHGAVVRLGAGNTWVELVPHSGAADFTVG